MRCNQSLNVGEVDLPVCRDSAISAWFPQFEFPLTAVSQTGQRHPAIECLPLA
ncbi:hypothetical protein [Proteus mirabilis]|uniref:hypothetical protein n=1 Tax=Proteus mirabilis TaxID=584 RepID=UPI0034DDB76D